MRWLIAFHAGVLQARWLHHPPSVVSLLLVPSLKFQGWGREINEVVWIGREDEEILALKLLREEKQPGKQYCISQGSESQVTPPRRKMEEGAGGIACSPQLSARCQSVFLLSGRQAGEVIGCTFPCATSDTSFHPRSAREPCASLVALWQFGPLP